MEIGKITSTGITITGGFFAGVLIGYAIKKVIKLVAVIVGLFLAALAYLQYQQIVSINWLKVQSVSQNAIAVVSDAASQIHDIATSERSTAIATLSDFGIPLTGSMSFGFAIGFMKG